MVCRDCVMLALLGMSPVVIDSDSGLTSRASPSVSLASSVRRKSLDQPDGDRAMRLKRLSVKSWKRAPLAEV